jgi:hypothetical protein
MNLEAMQTQITNDENSREGKKREVNRYKNSLVSYSREIWGFCGYSGLMKPWHVNPEESLKFSYSTVYSFIEYLEENDISLEAYAFLIFPITDYKRFETIGKLVGGGNKGERSWMKKLRKYCGSVDLLDEVAGAFLDFIKYQVEINGCAKINRYSIVKKDEKGKSLDGFHRLADRIRQLKENNIDPEIWIQEKIRKFKEYYPKEHIHFNTLLNMNNLDPNLEELKKKSLDEWREIREFLGLTADCEFIDGCIPKGWQPLSVADRDRIVKINKDGFYSFDNGVQYKGKRHYSTNTYFAIKCYPSNFNLFKNTWNDISLLSATPTWEEFSKWAVYPQMFNEQGESNGNLKVKWRKKT